MKRNTNCEYRILVHCKEEEDNDKIYSFFKPMEYRALPIGDVNTGARFNMIIGTVEYCKANGKDAVFLLVSTPITYDMEIVYNMLQACAGDIQISECWFVEKDLEHGRIDEGLFTYAYAVNKFDPIIETECKRSYEDFGSHLHNKEMYKPIIDIMNDRVFIKFATK